MSEDLVVVAGGGGYIGRHLVSNLVKNGFNVRAVVRRPVEIQGAEVVVADLFKCEDCRMVTRDARWVFNLAGNVGGIAFITNQRSRALGSSLINTQLLQGSVDAGVAGYFFASSSCVYPGNSPPVMKEGDAYPANPTTEYGWEKIFGERTCLAFNADYGTPVSILRYHGVYGPGDHRGDPKKDHVIAAMCRKVVQAKLSGNHEISIFGDGTQTRNFLYIDDCIKGTKRALFNNIQGPLNLANDEIVTVNQIVDLLEEIAAVKLTRFYSASVGVKHKLSDNTELRKAMAWVPMTPIRDGLEATYREFYDRALMSQ